MIESNDNNSNKSSLMIIESNDDGFIYQPINGNCPRDIDSNLEPPHSSAV